jgi:hypothetical protein
MYDLFMRVDGNLWQALTRQRCLSMARNARRRSVVAPRGRLLQRRSVDRVRSGSLPERQDRNGVVVPVRDRLLRHAPTLS